MRVDRSNEVTRNDPGALVDDLSSSPNPPPTHLVDELVEGVLPIGSRFTPNNRTSGMVHLLGLKVALILLLKVIIVDGTFSPALVTYFPLLSMSPCWK